MKHLFWLIENELCGRPGPNHEKWKVKALAKSGIGAILSVNFAQSVDTAALKKHNINHQCIPLAANAPPKPEELALCLERLPIAYEFVQAEIDAGKKVLVHCRHGKDRTGLFMAYYLMRRYHIGADEAISRVKQVRPIAFTAAGWDSFAPEVLAKVKPYYDS